MTTVTTVNAALPAGHRERLVQFARQVPFEAGARLFGEGRRAAPFWIARTGAVALDLHEPAVDPLSSRCSGTANWSAAPGTSRRAWGTWAPRR
ncbi:hypothetical protein AB0M68_34750 [Streptomyces sp. NPDC051453]|uniref:hypothetical protein n=1 Tax=Streptomyces sp. NPDC051453 TaxID=3154941 RepID=UPI003437A3B6